MYDNIVCSLGHSRQGGVVRQWWLFTDASPQAVWRRHPLGGVAGVEGEVRVLAVLTPPPCHKPHPLPHPLEWQLCRSRRYVTSKLYCVFIPTFKIHVVLMVDKNNRYNYTSLLCIIYLFCHNLLFYGYSLLKANQC